MRRTHARRVVLALAAAALVLGACTPQGPSEYGEEVRENFVSACTNTEGTPEPVCSCAYEGISSEIDFEQFEQLEDDLEDGQTPPPEITDIFARCAAQGPQPGGGSDGEGDSGTTTTADG